MFEQSLAALQENYEGQEIPQKEYQALKARLNKKIASIQALTDTHYSTDVKNTIIAGLQNQLSQIP